MNSILLRNIIILLIFASPVFAGYPSADTSALRSHIDSLCTIQPPRSIQNLSSLEKAAKYIEDQFLLYTNRVESQNYAVSYGEVRNIIASFGHHNGSRIIVGAHYDVAGDQPGADDNASGIAGLIELARLLSMDTSALNRRVDLVAYTLEEPPFFRTKQMGSYIHAKSLHDQGIEIEVMVALEMIGYYSGEDDSQDYPVGIMKWFYPTIGNFIAIVSHFGNHFTACDFADEMEQNCAVPIERLTAPSSVPGVDFSDHLNYWKFGYKALMITDTAFLRNNNYHQYSDTPETLDYVCMAEVLNGVYYAMQHFHIKRKKMK